MRSARWGHSGNVAISFSGADETTLFRHIAKSLAYASGAKPLRVTHQSEIRAALREAQLLRAGGELAGCHEIARCDGLARGFAGTPGLQRQNHQGLQIGAAAGTGHQAAKASLANRTTVLRRHQ